jgi:uncharacterized protein
VVAKPRHDFAERSIVAQFQHNFVWYELLTTDTEAAKGFYRNVMGWGTQRPSTSLPGVAYTLFTVGERPVSGVMELPEEARKMGAPPNWLGYVGVEDVDAMVGRIKARGGIVRAGPHDIPNVGRFAIVADPQDATFALFKWSMPSGAGQPAAAGTAGHVGWHELMAANWETAFEFYAELFGWKKMTAVDMGPMGTYQIFSADGTQAIGGMFTKPAAVPHPFWLYYVNVPAIDAAIERTTSAGGQIANGPMEVPGGSWIAQCLDPQGVLFAMVAPRR